MAFIGIDREIENHWIYQDAEYFKVWFEILLRARYSADPEKKLIEGKLVTIGQGQFIFGRISWSNRLKISERRLRTIINKLMTDNMISLVAKHSKFTIYTVVNYAKYNANFDQQSDQQKDHQSDHLERLQGQGISGTSDHQSDQQKDRISTSKRPSSDQQATTQEQGSNKVNNVYIKDIYAFWNQQSIIIHRELTQKMSSKINARLKTYSDSEIKEAVSNYKTIITSELYWYTHKFTLEKFMDPKNLEQFMSSNNPFENFRKKLGGGNGGKYGQSNVRNEEENRRLADKDADLFISNY